mgnify:CR=1 FL=1
MKDAGASAASQSANGDRPFRRRVLGNTASTGAGDVWAMGVALVALAHRADVAARGNASDDQHHRRPGRPGQPVGDLDPFQPPAVVQGQGSGQHADVLPQGMACWDRQCRGTGFGGFRGRRRHAIHPRPRGPGT